MLRIKDAKKSFFTSKEHYEQFKAAWSKAANLEKEADRPGPDAYIVYSLFRGYPENWGFTPITNPKKLESGRKADEAWRSARSFFTYTLTAHAHHKKFIDKGVVNPFDRYLKIFDRTITQEQLILVIGLLNVDLGLELKEVYLPGFEKDNNSGI